MRKLLIDYTKEILDIMVANQTLKYDGVDYWIADSIGEQEVVEALVWRFSDALNDYLKEPYGIARRNGNDTTAIIEDAITTFDSEIIKTCTNLGIRQKPGKSFAAELRENLAERYIQ